MRLGRTTLFQSIITPSRIQNDANNSHKFMHCVVLLSQLYFQRFVNQSIEGDRRICRNTPFKLKSFVVLPFDNTLSIDCQLILPLPLCLIYPVQLPPSLGNQAGYQISPNKINNLKTLRMAKRSFMKNILPGFAL